MVVVVSEVDRDLLVDVSVVRKKWSGEWSGEVGLAWYYQDGPWSKERQTRIRSAAKEVGRRRKCPFSEPCSVLWLSYSINTQIIIILPNQRISSFCDKRLSFRSEDLRRACACVVRGSPEFGHLTAGGVEKACFASSSHSSAYHHQLHIGLHFPDSLSPACRSSAYVQHYRISCSLSALVPVYQHRHPRANSAPFVQRTHFP